MKSDTGKINEDKYLRDEYAARINRVLDYIDKNLEKKLSLSTLAKVANFSEFHFHRIFSAMVGETLNQFIQRVRIEKAASSLLLNPKKSITEIAFDCGFSGSAAFARVFKESFEMSASQWRNQKKISESKIRKMKSKMGKPLSNMSKDTNPSKWYIEHVNGNQLWRIKMSEKKEIRVEVKKIDEMNVAYVRNIGPYAGDAELFEELFGKLMKWAGPRELLNFPETKMISVYHDNPDITDHDKLRLSACITVPEGTEIDGEVGKMVIAGGQYAIGHFEINVDEYSEAWDDIYGKWLPESGWQPDDKPCFELYLNDPEQHPERKCVVDIYVPVKPL